MASSITQPNVLDRLLLNSRQLTDEIRAGATGGLTRRLVVIAAGSAALFGVALGFQGGPLQAALTAVKVPIALLCAAGVSLPVLHVSCALMGHRLRYDQLSAHVLQSLATATVTMAGLAPFIVVAWLTVSATCDGCVGPSPWFVYRRVVLAGAAVAAIGAMAGGLRLLRAVPLRAAVPWAVVFNLAGLQLGWLVRPIVGMPDGEFVMVRALDSNALTEVLSALIAVLS